MEKKNNIIAIVGKGGVGKTTIAGLIVKLLIDHKSHPILVVDADPNTGLDIALGLQLQKTIGGIREETREIIRNGEAINVSKQELLEMKIAESMIETDFFDFIAMGRPEGPGCYCYANNILKSTLTKLINQYPYIVIDNEAGLENLSRRITPEVSLLIIVSDPSKQGVKTVERLYQLVHEMGIKYTHLALIINRLRRVQMSPEISELKLKIHADFLVGILDDLELMERNEAGRNIMSISNDHPAVQQIDQFLSQANQYRIK